MAAVDELIATLGQNVETGLGHFRRIEPKLKPGIYGPRELLCKLEWWLKVAADGVESVNAGGKPYQVHASDEEMDLRAVTRNTGKTVSQLAELTAGHQSRLAAAGAKLADAGSTIFIHGDGSADSASQRVEALSQRWKTSIGEIQGL